VKAPEVQGYQWTTSEEEYATAGTTQEKEDGMGL
jgi:hypothetical protein